MADAALLAASDRFDIVVEGVGAHAAWPHVSRDPVVAAAAIVSALQTIASRNVGPLVEFVRHFSKGHHTVTLSDGRLKPDRWTLRLQATNSVGSGPITIIDVHVVKHD